MPKVIGRIISLALCLVLAFSSVPALAAGSIWDALEGTVSDFWDFVTFKAYRDWLFGAEPEASTAPDAHNQYVTNLQNNYNVTNINAGGYSVFYPTGWTYGVTDANFSLTGSLINDDRIMFFDTSSLTCDFGYSSSERITQSASTVGAIHVVGMSASFSVPSSGAFSVFASDANGGSRYSFLRVMCSQDGGQTWSQVVTNSLYPVSLQEGFSVSFDSRYLYRLAADWFPGTLVENTQYRQYVHGAGILIPAPATEMPSESRVGKYSGNYAYEGDDGQVAVGENIYIVDETNSTFYNPVTNTTSTVKDWTYNYDNRSYEITLENGDKVTVTYGDQNITIDDSTTTYNIYYYNPDGGGGGGGGGGGDTCDHSYTSEVLTEPTCSTPGSRKYTCSKCGNTYTETIPAKGHTWVVDRTVQTTYDDQGNLLQQGYTIYRCSVCGEQYKDSEGVGPPSGGGGSGDKEPSLWDKIGEFFGSIFGGLFEIIGSALSTLLDALIGIVKGIIERLGTIVSSLLSIFAEVPGMFAGFTAFLSAVFPFLPPEFTTIIIFGLLAVVLVAIIKHFIR